MSSVLVCEGCGKRFRTAAAAFQAATWGCPRCSGTDIRLDVPGVPSLRHRPLRWVRSGRYRPCPGAPGSIPWLEVEPNLYVAREGVRLLVMRRLNDGTAWEVLVQGNVIGTFPTWVAATDAARRECTRLALRRLRKGGAG